MFGRDGKDQPGGQVAVRGSRPQGAGGAKRRQGFLVPVPRMSRAGTPRTKSRPKSRGAPSGLKAIVAATSAVDSINEYYQPWGYLNAAAGLVQRFFDLQYRAAESSPR